MSEFDPDPVDEAPDARRVERRRLDLRREQLSNALGVSLEQLRRYEGGGDRVPASALVRIAAKLGVTVADLIGEAPAKALEALQSEGLDGSGAASLLELYARIEEAEVRRTIVDLAQALATQAETKPPGKARETPPTDD